VPLIHAKLLEEIMQNFDCLYDASYFGDSLYGTHKVEKKLSYSVIKNGIILPGREVDMPGWIMGVGGSINKR
jgi:hypothetical protein